MSRLKTGGAIAAVSGLAALAITFVGGQEGLRLKTYRDIVGVPTDCYGETLGARMGQTFTKPQCDAKLAKRLDQFADGMERCVPAAAAFPAERYVAHLSLSYNIGTGAYCGSSVARLANAGETRASCDAFLRWNKAGGRVVTGLTRRRHEERELCLKGLP